MGYKEQTKGNAKFGAEIGKNAKNLMAEESETNNKKTNQKRKKKCKNFQREREEKHIHTK